MPRNEETKGPKITRAVERCKEVGRVGPNITKMDPETMAGNVKIVESSGNDQYMIEGVSRFSSIRANTAVFSGRYYYEVKIFTDGIMQIGWCTLATPFLHDRGVGDDPTSYAYDGNRVKKWNDESSSYGEKWAPGDTIGTMIDFQNREITFYRNDVSLGVAFKSIKIGPNMAYFPALSISDGDQVQFNFGDLRPFKYRPTQTFIPSITPPTPPPPLCALTEPQCLIKNYHSTA